MAANRGQLRWRCRRGMKELDVLLLRFLEEDYTAAGVPLQAAFEAVLELPDPEILGYLFGRASPASQEMTHVVARLASYRT